MTSDRNINIDDGNYTEKVQGNYIKADQVVINHFNDSDTNKIANESRVPQTSLIDKQNLPIKAEALLVLTAKLTADNKALLKDQEIELRVIIAHIEEQYGLKGKLTIKYLKEGSIKIGLGGEPEDLAKLQELFQSGQLNEILGIPIEDVRLVTANNSDEKEEISNAKKARLIKKIRTNGAKGKDLRDTDLSNADLRKADLRDANLRGAILRYADLRDANLRDAILRYVDLSSANLSGADLSGAKLYLANLSDANLRDTKLFGAELTAAKLSGADLSNADLSGAKQSKANLINTKLIGTTLRCVSLINADLSGADLSGADLSDANLYQANLTKAYFNNATKVENALFGNNHGIEESLKQDLLRRGAIFEDAPDNFAKILTRV
ncbi:MAG: pentapeptide repeat-containing protein [Cyanobacteria bacterium P01_G01_bin.39]